MESREETKPNILVTQADTLEVSTPLDILVKIKERLEQIAAEKTEIHEKNFEDWLKQLGIDSNVVHSPIIENPTEQELVYLKVYQDKLLECQEIFKALSTPISQIFKDLSFIIPHVDEVDEEGQEISASFEFYFNKIKYLNLFVKKLQYQYKEIEVTEFDTMSVKLSKESYKQLSKLEKELFIQLDDRLNNKEFYSHLQKINNKIEDTMGNYIYEFSNDLTAELFVESLADVLKITKTESEGGGLKDSNHSNGHCYVTLYKDEHSQCEMFEQKMEVKKPKIPNPPIILSQAEISFFSQHLWSELKSEVKRGLKGSGKGQSLKQNGYSFSEKWNKSSVEKRRSFLTQVNQSPAGEETLFGM